MARKPKNASNPDVAEAAVQASAVNAQDHDAGPEESGSGELEHVGRDSGPVQDRSGDRGSQGLGPNEFAAICAEAWDAHDFQDERIRFDTLGRKWTFRPGKVRDVESVLELIVSRIDVSRTDTISTAVLASDMARDMIADVVRAMSEGVG